MKAKTIKSVLSRKLRHWCEHIDDESVRTLVEQNTIVTGGSIVSMLLGEPPNDFDVYLRTPEAVFAVADYYLRKFRATPPTRFKGENGAPLEMFLADGHGKPLKQFGDWSRTDDKSSRLKIVIQSAGIASEDGLEGYEYFEAVPDPEAAGEFVEQAVETAEASTGGEGKNLYRPVFLTANAITLSDKVQVITRFYGEPEEIHENYDFVHCTNYWSSWDGHLELRREALECILNKELRYVGSRYPLCSIFRVRKFLDRGWRVNAGQLLKACMQISKLDLTDVDVLEDQLTGVDAAYFREVVDLCRKRMQETGADRIDSAYLVEIIDRLF